MAAPTRADVRATREGMSGIRETRQTPVGGFEIREVPNGSGGTNLKFTGYASTTCAGKTDLAHMYEMEDWIGSFQEGIVRGAFTKTLDAGADVAFLVNHGGVSMARTKPGTLRLSEDNTGLYSEALLNPTRTDVQILRAAIEDGAIDEMSFAFRVLRQTWSYVEENGVADRRWITEVSLDKGDVSAVNYGANPHTGGLVAIRNRFLGTAAPRLGGRRAAGDDCNRCGGDGQIDLGSGLIACPQCKGTGTGENNALAADAAAVAAETDRQIQAMLAESAARGAMLKQKLAAARARR